MSVNFDIMKKINEIKLNIFLHSKFNTLLYLNNFFVTHQIVMSNGISIS